VAPAQERVRLKSSPAPPFYSIFLLWESNFGKSDMRKPAETLTDSEIGERMDRALRRMMETPPTPHKALRKKKVGSKKRTRKAKSPS
jgi:hypothetical protein